MVDACCDVLHMFMVIQGGGCMNKDYFVRTILTYIENEGVQNADCQYVMPMVINKVGNNNTCHTSLNSLKCLSRFSA